MDTIKLLNPKVPPELSAATTSTRTNASSGYISWSTTFRLPVMSMFSAGQVGLMFCGGAQ